MTTDTCEELRRKMVLGSTYTKEMGPGKFLSTGTLKDMEQKMWFKPTDEWYSKKWEEFKSSYNRIMSLGYDDRVLRQILRERGIRVSLLREYDTKCKK